MRADHLLPPGTEVSQQVETPTVCDSSPYLSTPSEGASRALPSYLAGRLTDLRQFPTTQANMLRQCLAEAGDDVGTRRAVTDKPRGRRRRRRRSSPRDGGSEDAGKQGRFLLSEGGY